MNVTLQFPVSLVNQITESLTNAIIEGELIGGQRLVESDLQKKFSVSRAPIRESLRILENLGLLTNEPRKGRFVRRISKKDIEENFIVRANLESLAARLAVPNMVPKDISDMEMLLSEMTSDLKHSDLKSYFKHNYDYHYIFIHASKNDTLIGILGNLRRQAIWITFALSSNSSQEYFEYALSEHRKIIDLFIKKDADQLEAFLKEHILIGIEKTIRVMESKIV
jgi:DNA-binding GntR family transcriptional regulator